MPRICIVRRDYYPIVPHVRRDARALRQAGYDVDVVCLRAPGQRAREWVEGVRVYRLPQGKRRGGAFRRLLDYVAFFLCSAAVLSFLHLRKRYDAIEIDTMPDFLVFAALVPKLLGAKVVLYLFECMPEIFEHDYRLSPGHPLVRVLRFVERHACRFAHHVVYCGAPYRRLQEPRVGKDIPGTDVLNVPDEALFPPSRVTPPRLDLDGRPFRLITHGSLLERYGVQTLIRAVPLMRAEVPHLEVYVVGDGEYLPALRALSRELGVEDTVVFTGRVPPDEVATFIAEADVGVVCFFHHHAIASKLFEYMAMQRPVVHAATRFTMELCANGEVLFYPPGNAEELARCVVHLYRNPGERRALVERASRLYQECRWSVTRERYLDVYRRLVGAPRPRGARTMEEEPSPVGSR